MVEDRITFGSSALSVVFAMAAQFFDPGILTANLKRSKRIAPTQQNLKRRAMP